jgi:hypothetical protein
VEVEVDLLKGVSRRQRFETLGLRKAQNSPANNVPKIGCSELRLGFSSASCLRIFPSYPLALLFRISRIVTRYMRRPRKTRSLKRDDRTVRYMSLAFFTVQTTSLGQEVALQ